MYWFIVHDILAYIQHPELIGNRVKKAGIPEPKRSKFKDIKKGDQVVYYASGDYVVTGIFEIVSDMQYLKDDKYWGEIMVYEIKPVLTPPPGFYLDFKKLLFDPSINFDMFPEKRLWGRYLQGRTCNELSDRDFLTIKSAISDQNYLRSIEGVKPSKTRWQRKYGKEIPEVREPKESRHQLVINKWKEIEENKFGLFKPEIMTNNVDLNEVLPRSIWLKENTKYVDGLARLQIGGQPIYQSMLEVQHRGSKEDLCVRVSIILPFVTRVDIVSDERSLKQIQELMERIADPNIVKSRVNFYAFKEFLK